VTKSELDTLRLVAAYKYAAGIPTISHVAQQMCGNVRPHPVYTLDVMANMIWFSAKHKLAAADYMRSEYIKAVKVYGANDNLVCQSCRELQSKEHPLHNIPELPNPECTCENGCRCIILPIIMGI
jgi:hypothetical protein